MKYCKHMFEFFSQITWQLNRTCMKKCCLYRPFCLCCLAVIYFLFLSTKRRDIIRYVHTSSSRVFIALYEFS